MLFTTPRQHICLVLFLAVCTAPLVGCGNEPVREGPATLTKDAPAYDQGSMFRSHLSEEVDKRKQEERRKKALSEAATEREKQELRDKWERQEAMNEAMRESFRENASLSRLQEMIDAEPQVLGEGLRVNVVGHPALTDSLLKAATAGARAIRDTTLPNTSPPVDADTALVNNYRIIEVQEGLHEGSRYAIHESALANTN